MKQIQLTQGQCTLIDDEDFERVSAHKWLAAFNKQRCCFIAQRTVRKNTKAKTILMHRFIVNPPVDMQVDHKNHNTLDNRKSNLRVCTRTQNSQNRLPAKRNKTGLKGVYWLDRLNKWHAQINFGEFALLNKRSAIILEWKSNAGHSW